MSDHLANGSLEQYRLRSWAEITDCPAPNHMNAKINTLHESMMEKANTGNVFGGILLVSGCCIGAGMLGLPVLSALAGWKPSVVMFLLSWLFMTCTGLLLLEVNLWFTDEVNIVSMASRTLGLIGKIIAWSAFLFLFYSLMVAFVAASGTLFVDFFEQFTRISLQPWVGSLICSSLLAVLLYIGTRAIDRFNRLLMMGLIASYIALVVMGSAHVNPDLLTHSNWAVSTFALPAMLISFGYHNLVPSLTTYLNRNRRQLQMTIIMGSTIPLVCYLVWEWVILGLVPIEGDGGLRAALEQGQMATQALKTAIANSWVVDVAQYFAFFAIVTSFMGVSLSFVDFLADGLNIKKTSRGKVILCLLVLVPPFVCALLYPGIFLSALSYAGGFGAVILFGILPALMVWSGRYYKKMGTVPLVPGGKLTLVLVILFSCVVMGLQIAQKF